jgi:glyoxylase-like metal-dependent hydrolase (beta-lactamase superfamily II)
MAYLTEPEPPRGRATSVAVGVRRIVAPNSGPMTYHGTNTYLLEERDGLVVIDPGPADENHIKAIVDATGGRVARILLTHTHQDHSGAVAALRRATGAQVASFHRSSDPDIVPDLPLKNRCRIGALHTVHTPGHALDHLCFAREDGLLFSGDHVMAWCSTVVSPPPWGNMSSFFESLRLLIRRPDKIYLPGHGPALPFPQAYVQDTLDRRMRREREIERAVNEGLSDPVRIAGALYDQQNQTLRRAAERNVLSHLSKLNAEGRVMEKDAHWYAVT